MTEQNVSLIKLSILLSRFSNMAKYNLSSGRESPKKAQSHNAQKSLQKKGPRPLAYLPGGKQLEVDDRRFGWSFEPSSCHRDQVVVDTAVSNYES